MNTANTSASRDSVTRLGVVRRSVRSALMVEPWCNLTATSGATRITPATRRGPLASAAPAISQAMRPTATPARASGDSDGARYR